ncbi:MAG: zinc-ribbon domain-containing protein, partial [Microvirga sp.]
MDDSAVFAARLRRGSRGIPFLKPIGNRHPRMEQRHDIDVVGRLAQISRPGPVMKLFKCQNCGQLLYFENRRCERCGFALGYLPAESNLSALRSEGDVWEPLATPGTG